MFENVPGVLPTRGKGDARLVGTIPVSPVDLEGNIGKGAKDVTSGICGAVDNSCCGNPDPPPPVNKYGIENPKLLFMLMAGLVGTKGCWFRKGIPIASPLVPIGGTQPGGIPSKGGTVIESEVLIIVVEVSLFIRFGRILLLLWSP